MCPLKSESCKLCCFCWRDVQLLCAVLIREEAMLYGSIVTFLGWTLYGLVSPRFELKNKHG